MFFRYPSRCLGFALCGLTAVSLLFAQPLAAQSSKSAEPLAAPLTALAWKDVNGKTYDLAAITGHKATVFFFTSTQCPISGVYTGRINRLAKAYEPKGVQCFVVNSNREDTLETVRKDAQERGYACPVVKDDGTALADLLSADRTPEAILVDAQAVIRYRGRIDDSVDAEKIVRQDVKEALDALLAGKTILRTRTLALGCYIFREKVAPTSATTAKVTYARDIAPILDKNCASCHRPGETAPFSLLTYQQAQTWAQAIKYYTANRLMPPWKPVPGFGEFHDAKRLTDDEIARVAQWADSGAPQGDPAARPAPPKFPAAVTSWTLGKPSVVLQPDRPYHLAAEGKDVYRNFIVAADTGADRYINGVECQPDNRAVVHHIILYLDRSGLTQTLDKKEKEPGYTVSGTGIGVPFEQTDFVGGWAPGNTYRFLPKGAAIKIPKGANLVLQVHYHKNGKPQTDRSQVALYYTEKSQVAHEIRTGSIVYPYLSLKPGDAHQEVTQSLTLRDGRYGEEEGITIWTVQPHMHMLGKEMKLTATLPDGTTKPLVYVNDWDFNWQEMYHYKKPVFLPKGTTIKMEAVFDNSEKNPRQPSHPPVLVRWGEQTTDEMCIGFYQYSINKKPTAKRAPAKVSARPKNEK